MVKLGAANVECDSIKRGVRVVLLLAAGLLAGSAAVAQENGSPVQDVVTIQERPGYVDAVQKIAQGKEREGITALQALAEQFATDPDLYLLRFNVACGEARLGDLEAAFAELDRAITAGYGIHPMRLANLREDPDLASLRGDPRYPAAVAKATAQQQAIHDGWEQLTAPFIWLPPALPADDPAAKQPLPLLIVLHPYGAEREAFARELYLPFCEAQRCALLSLSGTQIIGPACMAWTATDGDFLDHFRAETRRVWHALEELRAHAAIDPQRIYVSGAGQGAGLAFAVVMRNPQWVRGAVLFDGGYAPATLDDWWERAAAAGRRVAFVHGESNARYPLAPLAGFVTALKAKGMAVDLFPVPGDPKLSAAAVTAALTERLPWIDQVPFQRTEAVGR